MDQLFQGSLPGVGTLDRLRDPSQTDDLAALVLGSVDSGLPALGKGSLRRHPTVSGGPGR